MLHCFNICSKDSGVLEIINNSFIYMCVLNFVLERFMTIHLRAFRGASTFFEQHVKTLFLRFWFCGVLLFLCNVFKCESASEYMCEFIIDWLYMGLILRHETEVCSCRKVFQGLETNKNRRFACVRCCCVLQLLFNDVGALEVSTRSIVFIL